MRTDFSTSDWRERALRGEREKEEECREEVKVFIAPASNSRAESECHRVCKNVSKSTRVSHIHRKPV